MLDKFIAEHNGKVTSFDNVAANAGQSLQLLAQWCAFIGLPYQWANPYAWWDDSDETFLEHWDKVVNDRKDAEQLPKPGDIIIFDTSLPGSGGLGHGTIFMRNIAANAWEGFDANWGGKSAHPQIHNWSYVLGWFTPRQTGAYEGNPTPIGDEAPSDAFELQELESKVVTLKNDAPLYNLNDVDWASFQANVPGQGKQGEDIVVKALARHRLGGSYYMPDPARALGYRVIDCDDHGTPLPAEGWKITSPLKQKPDRFPQAPVIAPIKEPLTIDKEIPRYGSMGDASNGVNSTGVLAPGAYYLYKTLGGMQCLTAELGQPLGWWINPDDLMSAEEKLKLNWRTTYKPFRDQYGNVAPRYYRALNTASITDLEEQHRDLAISRRQPILIRGWFVGPDGVVYGRPDDCVSGGELQWYGARRSNLERIPDPTLQRVPQIEELVIDEPPIPTFRDKLESIVPDGFKGIFDILKTKA